MNREHEIILLILYNLMNQNQIITVDAIEQNLLIVEAGESDAEKDIAWLVENGLISIMEDMSFALTEVGKNEAYKIARQRNKEDFNRLIYSAVHSSAYLDFCEEVYGYGLYLFNMMDKLQLDYLFNSVPVSINDTILDLGCGTGSILNRLVEQYGCRGIGLDELDEGIIKKDNRLITYKTGDLDSLSDYNIKPSITLSIDSLYFSSNLDGLLSSLTSIKQNRLYLYYSQYIFDEKNMDKSVLHRDNTRIALALQRKQISYRTIEYSENEQSLYENALRVMPLYKGAFENEGNTGLYDRKLKEYNTGKYLYDNGLASRYLYIVD